jgi:hypothetical protein
MDVNKCVCSPSCVVELSGYTFITLQVKDGKYCSPLRQWHLKMLYIVLRTSTVITSSMNNISYSFNSVFHMYSAMLLLNLFILCIKTSTVLWTTFLFLVMQIYVTYYCWNLWSQSAVLFFSVKMSAYYILQYQYVDQIFSQLIFQC